MSATPLPDPMFDPASMRKFRWEQLGVDDGGDPIHLPMGVTADGAGPTRDKETHHWICWCGDVCMLSHFLQIAWLTGRQRGIEDAMHIVDVTNP